MHVRTVGGNKDVPIKNPSIVPDLYASKSANVTCNAITYTISYGNQGGQTQTNTVLVDEYDETKVTVTNAGWGTDDGSAITWDIGNLATGASGTKSYSVSLKPGVAGGTAIINNGNITGYFAEVDTADNSYTVTSSAKVNPVANFTSNSPQIYCYDITFNGTATGGTPPYTYYWDFGDGSSSTEQNTSHCYSASGTYDVTLTVTDANGCTNSTTKPVVASGYNTGLSITKEANVTSATVGTVIGYTINVTNEGNVNLTSVHVTDSLTDLSQTIPNLTPGATHIFNTAHTVTESEICAPISNTATANGTDPCGLAVGPVHASVSVTQWYNTGLSVVKNTNVTSATVGTVIVYTINVTNEGNVNLTNVLVTDSLTGLSETIPILAPATSQIVNTAYTVTESDLCGIPPRIENTATANGTDPCGYLTLTAKGVFGVSGGYTATLSISKEANVTSATVGTVIGYTINVNNTGNVNLTNVLVTDVKLGLSETISLAPGATQTFNPTYTVTQSDICAPINNTATANGTDPCGSAVGPESASVSVDSVYNADLSITKSANVSSATVGDIIKYWYNVTNTGNVNLTSLTVTDTRLGDITLDKYALIPNEVAHGTKNYTVRQEDVCAAIVNNATADATDRCGKAVTNISADVTVTTPYTADLRITKEANVSSATVGDIIKYWYNVTNTGNVNLTGLTVTDTRLGGITVVPTALKPGEVARGTETYTVRQEDVCAAIVNNATADATDRCGKAVTNTSADVTVTTPYTADLMITKEANVSSATVGDIIKYWYNVTNTGNVNLTGLTVTDTRLGGITVVPTALKPGEVARGTETYTVTQSDICGSIVNNATANATDRCGGAVTNTSADVTVTTDFNADLRITKEANVSTAGVGDVIKYWYNVTNTGNVNLTGLTVTDTRLGGITVVPTALKPGEVARGTETYTVTQSDICGSIVNNATANATDPCTKFVENISADVTVTTPYTADLKITKEANVSSATVGDIIKYWYNVTNTGNVNLTSLTVTDSRLGVISMPPTTLAPNDVARGTKNYTVRHGDVCADIVNNATANATDPCTKFVENISADVTVTTPYTADLKITKEANVSSATVGDIIKYWYNVTNTGNVNLTSLTVTDSRLGVISMPPTTLAPNDVARGTKNYTVRHGDVCADIVNNATANATDPCTKFVENISADVTVTTPYTADLKITKEANVSSATVGDIIKYWYNVTNTGNVNLTSLSVTDSRLGAISMPPTTLAPNDVARGTKNYTVRHGDVCADIVNNATANATDPCTKFVENISADVTVTTPYTADLIITKEANVTSVTIGDIIKYWYNVTNTGNVNLTSLRVTDTRLGTITVLPTSLEPGDVARGTKTYAVSQADVCADIVNNATANATDPCTRFVEDTSADVTVTTPYTADLIITKEANVTSVTIGDTIKYWYNVTNTGNVNLTRLSVTDTRLGTITVLPTSLEPGDVARGTKTYAVSQADVCADIVNNATANATDPCTKFVEDTSADVTVTTPYTADLIITKEANVTSVTIGDTIKYWYNVTNTGNVNLTSLRVTDTKLGTITVLPTSLKPGDVARGTKTYAVSQAEVCADIVNNATANATDPCTKFVEDTSADVTVTTPYTADLVITKEANVSSATVGDIIKYWYNVTNTGNVNLTSLSVTDTKLGTITVLPTSLKPGDVARGTKTYAVSQADVCADIVNNATANATDPCTKFVEDTSADVTVTTPYTADLVITKEANVTSVTIGDTIKYWYNVTNTGNVNLTSLSVTDTKLGTITVLPTSLKPGDVARGTKTYAVSQADVCADIVNNATANATDPCTKFVENISADVTVTTPYTADLMITKEANVSSATVGDIIKYWYNVTNTGNVNLTSLTVTDTRLGGITVVPSALKPGDVARGTETYTVTQSDIYGSIVNNATANATDRCGVPVVNTSADVTVTTLYTADLMINKTASLTGTCPGSDPLAVSVGDTVTYCYNVTNSGDVTLTNLALVDSILGTVSLGGTTSLAPNAWATGTMTHVVDENDIPSVTNWGNVSSKDPLGSWVNESDTCTINVNIHPEVELEKSSSPTIVAPGGNVTYTINYTNTGEVPLTNVVITENYPKGVTFISASPAPDAGTNNVWTIGTLLPGESGTIVIKVKVPEQIDLSFTETGSVIGEGVVMITKDLSTEQKPYSLRNSVTLSCDELAPVSKYATTKVSGVPGTSLGITESGSGVYSSDENLDLQTKNKSIILKKSTHAEYKPTSFNFSDSFSVNFTNKWKQDICSKNMEIDAAIHKKISDATYIDDETISRVDKDKSIMNFDSSFNGSLHIGARTKDTEISETYIGEFDVLQTIHIAKGPIPTPAPTPTPTPIWLPCPFNASQEMNITEDAEPTHDAKIKIEMSANRTSATVGDVIRYSYVVTNIGNINLTGVTVTDSNLGLVDLNRTELEPTEVANGTLLYTVNQSDVCANITNTADVMATDGCGDPVTNTSNQVIVTTDS